MDVVITTKPGVNYGMFRSGVDSPDDWQLVITNSLYETYCRSSVSFIDIYERLI